MDARPLPFEQFSTLSALPVVRHGFTTRAEGVEVAEEKPVVLDRLDAVHREIRRELGMGEMAFATAEQVHGNVVAVVEQKADACAPASDAIVTNQRGICLGIYVADCCAVFLVDSVNGAIGLAHSGRKGTELRIVEEVLATMSVIFGTNPAEVSAQLSPCIRPPHYEIDFAAGIRDQLRRAGVKEIHDSGTCTACDLDRYYSYRAEKGRTGRMLALLALD